VPPEHSAHEFDERRERGGVRKQYFQGWWSVFNGSGWRRPASASHHRDEPSCLPMHAGEGVGPFDPKMDTTTTQTRIGRQNATSKGGIDDNNNNKTINRCGQQVKLANI